MANAVVVFFCFILLYYIFFFSILKLTAPFTLICWLYIHNSIDATPLQVSLWTVNIVFGYPVHAQQIMVNVSRMTHFVKADNDPYRRGTIVNA